MLSKVGFEKFRSGGYPMKQPNILLISFDSVRADVFGCYGNNAINTPNIDRLAYKGVVFENAIVQAPHTVPSHLSMFTGLFPFKHGLRLPRGQKLDRKRATTIFTKLQHSGYRPISFRRVNVLGERYGLADWGFAGDNNLLNVKRKLGAIISQNDTPFFAFIHYWGTHTPYEVILPIEGPMDIVCNLLTKVGRLYGLVHYVPIKFNLVSKFWWYRIHRIREIVLNQGYIQAIKHGYFSSIVSADQYVGKLCEILDHLGVLQNTLIVITSDHGDSFNEHSEIEYLIEHELNFEHGYFLYDNLIRVPLIIYFPSEFSHQVINEQVRSIDLAPTICEFAGVNYADAPIDGYSLLPLLHDSADYDRRYAYSETFLGNVEKRSIRTNEYKLIIDFKENEKQLFDLVRDPTEMNNVLHQHLDIAQRLERELHKLISQEKALAEADTDTGLTAEEEKQVEEMLRGWGYLD
jgi:choline-sulfatase